KGNKFINHIIHNGKKMYILDHLMPYQPDSIKLGYTAQQTEWVDAFELDIWGHFLKEEMMYSDNLQRYKSLISPAPKSAGLTEESPGEVGNWMGWQIVKAYMRRHPETTLQELINSEDHQEILVQSRYKPKR
ncbi:MAG: gliding motility lipoprotein GldB, partial [Bacteroidota bacterium]